MAWHWRIVEVEITERDALWVFWWIGHGENVVAKSRCYGGGERASRGAGGDGSSSLSLLRGVDGSGHHRDTICAFPTTHVSENLIFNKQKLWERAIRNEATRTRCDSYTYW